jgi:hypothetical protein
MRQMAGDARWYGADPQCAGLFVAPEIATEIGHFLRISSRDLATSGLSTAFAAKLALTRLRAAATM